MKNQSSENKLVITEEFIFDKINFQKIRKSLSLATPPPIAYKYNKNKNLIFFGISRWNYRPTSPYIFRKLFHFFYKKLFLMFIKTSKCIHSYLPHNSPLDRTLYRTTIRRMHALLYTGNQYLNAYSPLIAYYTSTKRFEARL